MQTSGEQGMLTMDNSIKKLYDERLIDESLFNKLIPSN
jgi:Tfp pilus assembly pilus retraction ATPase PilT